jgi:hypothetical protein
VQARYARICLNRITSLILLSALTRALTACCFAQLKELIYSDLLDARPGARLRGRTALEPGCAGPARNNDEPLTTHHCPCPTHSTHCPHVAHACHHCHTTHSTNAILTRGLVTAHTAHCCHTTQLTRYILLTALTLLTAVTLLTVLTAVTPLTPHGLLDFNAPRRIY